MYKYKGGEFERIKVFKVGTVAKVEGCENFD